MPLFAALILSVFGHAQSFELQPSPGDRFELRVYKTGLLGGKHHVILFEKYRGAADETRVDFTVEVGSLVVQDDWPPAKGKIGEIRKVALDEMLDAKNHPELRFNSTAIKTTGRGYEVLGNLTIRGKAQPVKVEIERKDGGVFEGKAQIKHSDYGLKRQTSALGAIGTRDEMDVIFRLSGKPRN